MRVCLTAGPLSAVASLLVAAVLAELEPAELGAGALVAGEPAERAWAEVPARTVLTGAGGGPGAAGSGRPVEVVHDEPAEAVVVLPGADRVRAAALVGHARLAAVPAGWDLPGTTYGPGGQVRADQLDLTGRPAFRLLTPSGASPVRLLLPAEAVDAALAAACLGVAAGLPAWLVGPALNRARTGEDAPVRGARR